MKEYFPRSHAENRMKNEGDTEFARQNFIRGHNRVLHELIRQRFEWMNEYISDDDQNIIELGCGAGLSKFFIKNEKLILTDVAEHAWVDENVDALHLEYPDNSLDVVICSHMIHHIANPAAFLDQISKKLRKGGRLIIQDIYTGSLMKIVLRIMKHEGFSDLVDVYDRNSVCNDPDDPWSANCSIPKLLFWNKTKIFESEFSDYTIIKRERKECFLFYMSGGVIAHTFYLPLHDNGVKVIKRVDAFLIRHWPEVFAAGCSVVLVKK